MPAPCFLASSMNQPVSFHHSSEKSGGSLFVRSANVVEPPQSQAQAIMRCGRVGFLQGSFKMLFCFEPICRAQSSPARRYMIGLIVHVTLSVRLGRTYGSSSCSSQSAIERAVSQ